MSRQRTIHLGRTPPGRSLKERSARPIASSTIDDAFDLFADLIGFASAGQGDLPAQNPERRSKNAALFIAERFLHGEPAKIPNRFGQRGGISQTEPPAIVQHALGRASLGAEGRASLE